MGYEAVECLLVLPPGSAQRVGHLAGVEPGDAAGDHALVDLGAEQDEAAAVVGELVGEGVGDALEQALAHEAAQVVAIWWGP